LKTQSDNHPVELRNNKVIDQKLKQIHQDPGKDSSVCDYMKGIGMPDMIESWYM
jgi:hypothetical protein